MPAVADGVGWLHLHLVALALPPSPIPQPPHCLHRFLHRTQTQWSQIRDLLKDEPASYTRVWFGLSSLGVKGQDLDAITPPGSLAFTDFKSTSFVANFYPTNVLDGRPGELTKCGSVDVYSVQTGVRVSVTGGRGWGVRELPPRVRGPKGVPIGDGGMCTGRRASWQRG